MRSLESSLATITGNISPQVQAYRDEMTALLGKLDEWSNPTAPTNDVEYAALSAIRSRITELSCFTFNNNLPENDRVWALESVYGGLQARYNRRLELKPGPDRDLARYLLSSKYFTRLPRATCLLEARDRGLLRRGDGQRHRDSALFVVGLHYKVGDNVFTISGANRHHRQYVGHIGRQALSVHQHVPFEDAQLQTFLATVPVLEADRHVVYVGDGKGMARPPAMRHAEIQRLYQLLNTSAHDANPCVGARPVAVPPPAPPAPAPVATQTDLFAVA